MGSPDHSMVCLRLRFSYRDWGGSFQLLNFGESNVLRLSPAVLLVSKSDQSKSPFPTRSSTSVHGVTVNSSCQFHLYLLDFDAYFHLTPFHVAKLPSLNSSFRSEVTFFLRQVFHQTGSKLQPDLLTFHSPSTFSYWISAKLLPFA